MPRIHEGSEDAAGLRFAVVVSRFNDYITDRLLDGCLTYLADRGADGEAIDVYKVPGAFEIPLQAKTCAGSGRFDAVICLGAVIQGETDHARLVAEQAARGVAGISLETGVPCIFEVLSTPNVELARARAGGEQGNRGEAAASAAIEAVHVLRSAANGA